jgi:hypothetical protein
MGKKGSTSKQGRQGGLVRAISVFIRDRKIVSRPNALLKVQELNLSKEAQASLNVGPVELEPASAEA